MGEGNAMSAIVLAGGFGFFYGPRKTKVSKVLAHLDGKPMICHILDKLLLTGLFAKFYVVTNTDYHDQIVHTLREYPNISYVTQSYRIGSAGAVQLALQQMDAGEENALTHYGDMPCFETDTYRQMVERHLNQDNPTLTMLTVPHVPGTPLETYGRVIFDADGNILRSIDDPDQIPTEQFEQAKEVNPSLYIGKVAWMKSRIPQIEPYQKPDGYPPELLMQKLVEMAYGESTPLARVRIEDHEQAYGVNKLHELRRAREFYRRRCRERTLLAA